MQQNSEDLKADYKKHYIFSWVDKVRLFFLVRRVYRQKITSLWEANLDKLFFETKYKNELTYNDSLDRQELVNERKKPQGEQNEARISEIENRITHAKAIKQSYRQNEDFIAEITNYIKMLELWMGKNQN